MGPHMLLLLVATFLAFATAQVSAIKDYGQRCDPELERADDYCYKDEKPYCDRAGCWSYKNCQRHDYSWYSGRGKGYKKSKCRYGSPYWDSKRYKWVYKKTCFYNKCRGYPDWDYCPYGGYPTCEYDEDEDKYTWNYDDCSYCDPSKWEDAHGDCGEGEDYTYCLYDKEDEEWKWECSYCKPSRKYAYGYEGDWGYKSYGYYCKNSSKYAYCYKKNNGRYGWGCH